MVLIKKRICHESELLWPCVKHILFNGGFSKIKPTKYLDEFSGMQQQDYSKCGSCRLAWQLFDTETKNYEFNEQPKLINQFGNLV